MTEFTDPFEKMPYCNTCEQKISNMYSHYHCGKCHDPRPTGMYGHWHSGHLKDGKWTLVEGHFTCVPGACEAAK